MQARLRTLLAEGPMLSERTCSEDPAQHLRTVTGRSPIADWCGIPRTIPTATQEDRDAICACVYRKPYPGLLSEESAKLAR
jgi:hypothetical protein